MNRLKILVITVIGTLVLVIACKKDPKQEVYTATPYALHIPPGFPNMVIPETNPLTVEGVALGKRLFYDPILSGDNTISCGSCHRQNFAFSDKAQLRSAKG